MLVGVASALTIAALGFVAYTKKLRWVLKWWDFKSILSLFMHMRLSQFLVLALDLLVFLLALLGELELVLEDVLDICSKLRVWWQWIMLILHLVRQTSRQIEIFLPIYYNSFIPNPFNGADFLCDVFFAGVDSYTAGFEFCEECSGCAVYIAVDVVLRIGRSRQEASLNWPKK